MKPAAPPLLLVPFREVRHEQPDDCLHYEPVAVRGKLHDWTIPAHRHDGLHQFQLLERGRASATIDGVDHEIEAPAIVMVAPGSIHGFRYARNTAGHQVTIPTAMLRQALQGAGKLEAQLAQSFVMDAPQLATDAADCVQLFESLAGEFRASHPGRVQALQAQATLIVLWFLWHRGAGLAGQRPAPMRDTLVQRLAHLVEEHYREHKPLAFYAAALKVTPDHLSRSCRSVTGQSALDLVHARLMLEARRLLAYTPMTVAQIAATLGYDDPAYFGKFFSRSVGEPPSAYRDAVNSGLRVRESQPSSG
jgi:AraC family transcriptional activator of pobA